MFEQLQMLIFEYLNFKPFLEELKDKTQDIKKVLDYIDCYDMGSTPSVICNVKCDPTYLDLKFYVGEMSGKTAGKTHFCQLNPKKMKIVMELLKMVNERRSYFGLKPNPGTYGFGNFQERSTSLFGCRLNSCYIAY